MSAGRKANVVPGNDPGKSAGAFAGLQHLGELRSEVDGCRLQVVRQYLGQLPRVPRAQRL